MKVILAGYSKTGTKTMYTALDVLGYKVYDYMDHFWYHGKEWEKILTTGGSIDDFKEMYKDVDAVTDVPAYCYWEEIHKAFPDSKIILMDRDEEKWCKSMYVQMEQMLDNQTYKLMQVLSPTGRRYFRYFRACVLQVLQVHVDGPYDRKPLKNGMTFRKAFRRHQEYCRQNAPKDKLLVYHVKEGWEPLCKFFGKEIPDKPFPHENVGGVIMNYFMETHPANLRMQKEMMWSLFIIFLFGLLAAYLLYQCDMKSTLFY